MAQRALTSSLLSPEDYLERKLESPVKHEFVDGAIYAMSGASDRHGTVALAFSQRALQPCGRPLRRIRPGHESPH